jgi:hypothetical protein
MVQRLQGGASLETAVVELLRGLPASFWPTPCKRVRDWQEDGKTPSSHSGAFNQARQALPLAVVQQSCDRIFEELVARMDSPAWAAQDRVFLLDGTTMRASHSPSLCHSYPPGGNQHGQGHWPLLRVLVAHDLRTGLAMRPEWGPMHGDAAVSEQSLVERAMDRLPEGATVLGDANFGVFSVAYASQQKAHRVLLRLTLERAKSLAAGSWSDEIDRPLVWKPSRWDRKHHPALPANACVTGRLLVKMVQPSNGAKPVLLALFTDLSASPEQIVAVYGQRWNIETDLRTLKSTLCLDQVTSTTPDMVAKEIDIALAAYNLVRAVICLASEQSGISPRGYSFTKILRLVNALGPDITNAASPLEARRKFKQFMNFVQQSKLPQRKRKRRSYPREIWNKGAHFPNRKTGSPSRE